MGISIIQKIWVNGVFIGAMDEQKVISFRFRVIYSDTRL